MSYIGENETFCYRDGACEVKHPETFSASEAERLGGILASFGSRFSAACSDYSYHAMLSAISNSLAEFGCDTVVCESTDLPSFRFGIPLISANCGIFISGAHGSMQFTLFDEKGLRFSDDKLRKVMEGSPVPNAETRGSVTVSTTFRELYIGNLRECLNVRDKIPASVSCGGRAVRTLWEEFFTCRDDGLVFQVSEDGQRANAYSSDVGFISHEKLLMTYVFMQTQKEREVWLPDDFHYAAELLDGYRLIHRFSAEREMPEDAVKQRFLTDTLFLCTQLSQDRQAMISAIRALPSFATSNRDISINVTDETPVGRTIIDSGGRIRISRSGSRRLKLSAQAYSAETASELCSQWTEKLRRSAADVGISQDNDNDK